MTRQGSFRTRAAAALVAAAAAGAALFGAAGPAAASSVSVWTLEICAEGGFSMAVNAGGSWYQVGEGSCESIRYQNESTGTYIVNVDAYVVGGGYIASAQVNIAQGAGLASGGSSGSPYLWSF